MTRLWTIECGSRTYTDVAAVSFGDACKKLGLDFVKCKVVRVRNL